MDGSKKRRTARGLVFALALLPCMALAQADIGGTRLRVILPLEGTAGLEAGAEVQVQGLKAGTVQHIAFGPQRRLVADILIEPPEARDFIRRDSPILIRARLGGVGSAYLFIGRGEGEALDWADATLEASPEPQQLQALEQLRDRALPVLEDMGRVFRFAATVVERAERGEGGFGRFLTDDQLARSVQETTQELTALLRGGTQLAQRFDALGAEAQRLMAESGQNGSLPALMRRVDQALANLQSATRDVSRATQRLPQTLRNVEESTGNVPGLLLQTQQTTRELELLLAQLRGIWLLGGSGPPPPEPRRPATERLRP